MSDERDRVSEMVEFLDKHARGGFGTGVITVSGRQVICSLDDLMSAVRLIGGRPRDPSV